MIISKGLGFTLPQQAAPVLSQTDGEFGWLPVVPLIYGGVAALLGAGTLWQYNRKRDERSDYLACIETYTAAPYNMAPEEAGLMCRGEKVKGFDFGLNAKTFILVAASVFGMWFVTQFLLTAAKSKIGGKK